MAQEKIGTRYDYEALRVILENEQGRPVTIEEAVRVGDAFMELYLAFTSKPSEE